MPDPLRLAFIGIDHPHGAGWRESLQQLGADVEPVAIVPLFDGAITSLEERYARLPRFETVSALLEWGAFDGALVCLPNNESPAVCAALANAGKHLIAEKPGARNAAEFTPVIEAVEKSGVAFQAGYLWRYDDGANRLREMVRDGRFGKLISVEMTMATSDVQKRGPDHYLFSKEASGRGFFSWLGCHYLDLLPYVTGEQVTAVTARVGVFGSRPCEVEDGGTVILELSGGGIATLVGGYWLPRWVTEAHWTIRGGQRWLKWDPAKPGTTGVFTIHGPQPQFHAMEEVFTLPPDSTPGYGGVRNVNLLRDWVREARGEGKFCRNGVRASLELLRLLDAVYESAELSQRIGTH